MGRVLGSRNIPECVCPGSIADPSHAGMGSLWERGPPHWYLEVYLSQIPITVWPCCLVIRVVLDFKPTRCSLAVAPNYVNRYELIIGQKREWCDE